MWTVIIKSGALNVMAIFLAFAFAILCAQSGNLIGVALNSFSIGLNLCVLMYAPLVQSNFSMIDDLIKSWRSSINDRMELQLANAELRKKLAEKRSI